MRNNIAFDIDGVTLHLTKKIIDILNRNYNIQIKEEDITEYEIWKTHASLTPQILRDVIDKAIGSEVVPLYDDCFSFFNSLYAYTTDPIVFYTSRKRDAAYLTYRNLKSIFPWPCYIYFNSGKKLQVAKYFKYFVEDRPEIILGLANAGVYVFVPMRPWNGELQHENIEYIRTLDELKPRIHKFII